ncbi:hypothetical protein FNV43_RR24701 [Rhamnella rubrinervis]|uniref:Uncharacterized protein n=1 Tax=Rhamnella rubrinervis TaxID=2594499 RepID=A0A8K0GPD4_9ROSA|nr:hypothetical protein FNV43_RR24701 [Rhamnella rubrinervis]
MSYVPQCNMQGLEGNPMPGTMKNVSRGLAAITVLFTMSFPKLCAHQRDVQGYTYSQSFKKPSAVTQEPTSLTVESSKLVGRNPHHIVEATFKAFARALQQAYVEQDTATRVQKLIFVLVTEFVVKDLGALYYFLGVGIHHVTTPFPKSGDPTKGMSQRYASEMIYQRAVLFRQN